MTNFPVHYLIAEDELTPDHHTRICDLLVLAFARYAELFRTASYYYSRPEYRLIFEDEQGRILAHLDFERRTIAVNGVEVTVAGVGEVAVHPERHKQGLGRKLMAQLEMTLREQFLVDYGFLQCRDEVLGFYQALGWQTITQPIHEQDIHSGETVVAKGNALFLPIGKTVDDWQTGGYVDLRGLPW